MTVSPHNPVGLHDSVPAILKAGRHSDGLELTADPRTEPRLEGNVVATTVRAPRDIPTSNERVYYKFSPRRSRFAETSMSIAAGPPR